MVKRYIDFRKQKIFRRSVSDTLFSRGKECSAFLSSSQAFFTTLTSLLRSYVIPLWVMSNHIPIVDDFGDDKLNRVARDYRNALNDRRPPFGNFYILERTRPLQDKVVSDLIDYFDLSAEQKTKVDPDEIDNILTQDMIDSSKY